MLVSLYAKNFALIKQVRVEFKKGLNIITGETGAGKSILVGALGALLGERLPKDIIRSGADKAIVEGIFKGPFSEALYSFLTENDLDVSGHEIMIYREINASGKSRSFINDTPVTLPILINVGDMLVDLHGQHQHQLLLQVSRHVDYLDDYAKLEQLLDKVQTSHERLMTLDDQLEKLLAKQKQTEKTRELDEFQLREIQSVDPYAGEDEELNREEMVLRNAELLFEKLTDLYRHMYENDGSALEILKSAELTFGELQLIDGHFVELAREISEARIRVEEVANAAQDYRQKISFDSERLEKIRQRIVAVNGLKKKYGGTIPALLDHKVKLLNEVAMMQNLHTVIEESRQKREEECNLLKNLSLGLSKERGQAGDVLAEKVSRELTHLGMSQGRFAVSNQYKDTNQGLFFELDGRNIGVGQKGIDHIEFFISANTGEPLKPLAQVASGGEISRIMLALKTLLAEADKVPVLVFDEIDLGISGRIAQAVGYSLKKLAKTHQIICITHLPQIASMADQHYLVEKTSTEEETSTQIRLLREDERTAGIARLFGGENVTDTHIQSALELIQEAQRITNNN
jgi:DNA repair protein RecN (Recombination protein N)